MGTGVKIVYNKLLRGWYVVRGPHQTPLSGRFDTKEEAQQSLLRKNPRRKRTRLTPGQAANILTGLTHPEGGRADFHSLRSDDVQYLLDAAKEVGYRQPKDTRGASKARYFYAFLQTRQSQRVRVGKDWGGMRPIIARKNPRNETAHELALYIINDSALYRRQTAPIILNLQRKQAKLTYDPVLALKLWFHLATSGAQKYFKEFGSPGGTWHQMFSVTDRKAVAAELADHYKDELLDQGSYKIGDRVELHPATDWWMRGARYGEITNIKPPIATIKLDKVKKRVQIHYDNILKVVTPVAQRVRSMEGPVRRTKRYHVTIEPYSLAQNRVGEPTGPATVISKHSSLTAARNKLGSLISGKGRGLVSTIVPRGDGYKIFVHDVETGQRISRTGHVLKKNPVGKFYICGSARGKRWYYRTSTQSFTDNKANATAFRSREHAKRVAKSILNKLPASIPGLTVHT